MIEVHLTHAVNILTALRGAVSCLCVYDAQGLFTQNNVFREVLFLKYT